MMRITHIIHAGYVIEADGQVWLYDTSTRTWSWQILAYLWRGQGVRYIDGIILSHFHFDHAGGASRLIERWRGKVGGVYSSGAYSHPDAVTFDDDGPRQDALDAVVAKWGLAHTHVKRGDTLAGGMIDILAPEPGAIDSLPLDASDRRATDHPNDQHNVLARFNHGDFSILFTGDTGPAATKKGFNDAIAASVDLSASVLAWPHHGDVNYMTEAILDEINPSLGLLEGNPNIAGSKTMMDGKSISWVEFAAEDPHWQLVAQTDGTWTTGHARVPVMPRGAPAGG